jgi:hypothetical protein
LNTITVEYSGRSVLYRLNLGEENQNQKNPLGIMNAMMQRLSNRNVNVERSWQGEGELTDDNSNGLTSEGERTERIVSHSSISY